MIKTLKNVTILLFLVSCNAVMKSKLATTGVVNVLNGKGVIDTVRFSCDSCNALLGSKKLFDSLITVSSAYAKNSLKNTLSFIPRKIKIDLRKVDSLYYINGKKVDSCVVANIEYNSIGKNTYGTEMEVNTTQSLYIVNNTITDLDSKLKKEVLQLTASGEVNRRLLLFTDDNKSLAIQPMVNEGAVNLIVTSSITCVDKGARCIILFDDSTEMKFSSWNKFNCESLSYYTLPKIAEEKMKVQKVKHITFYTMNEKDGMIFCGLPENDKDYFMQYMNLRK